jgi:integrase
METYSKGGVTLSVYLDTRRPKDDLTFPVQYRVTYLRKRVYHKSKFSLTEDDWKILSSTKKRELSETRELIQAGFDNVKVHIKEMLKGEGFSHEGLNKRLSGGRKNSILTSFYNKIEKLTKDGQIGTASTYQCAINSIMKFSEGRDLKFSDITIDWLKKYENYLTTERIELMPDGKSKVIKARSITTVKFYITCVRTILNGGKEYITANQYPFGEEKYEIKSGDGRKMALTLAQIKVVLDYPLLTDNEKKYRDLWYFSYMCNGINVNDMCRLKYKDIVGGEIHFYRQKTIRTTKKRKEIVATYLPQMQEIVRKWGNPDKNNYIFPFLLHGMSPKREKEVVQNITRLINRKMVAISKALNYDRISTYTARHSFATVLKRSGATIAFISEALGHTDEQMTGNYLAYFEQEKRAENASKLTDF